MQLIIIIYMILFFFGIFFLMLFALLHYKNRIKLYEYPIPKVYPSISILVPAYNEEDSLEGTVESLIKLDYPKDKKQIIIINDGSKDKTADIALALSKKYKNILFIDKPNSGKANSLNQGIKSATGELFAVVDADSYPKPDSLKKMIGYFEDPIVAAVTSRVLVRNKKNLLEKYQVLDYSIIAWTRKLLDFVDSVYVTNGPLSVYRTSVVRKVGGFDPKNLTEDIELTWNLLSKGYKTKMSYSSIVYTVVPDKFNVWVNQRVRWNLGGLQTAHKYRKYMFRNTEQMFGNFVVPYVSASFILAIIGFLLIIRYFWIRGNYYAYAFYYAFHGYNAFKYIDFSFNLSFLFFLSAIFFILAVFYYKAGFSHSEAGKQSVLKILLYSVIYRALYVVPLIIALYKLAKGDIRWYTK